MDTRSTGINIGLRTTLKNAKFFQLQRSTIELSIKAPDVEKDVSFVISLLLTCHFSLTITR